jgi:hypothetical protein
MSTMQLERSSALAEASTWIQNILDHTGWTATELGRRAHVAPSTVLRIKDYEDHRFQPSLRTLQKLATAASMAIPRAVIEACGADNVEPGDPVMVPVTPKSVRDALSTLSRTAKLGKQLSIPVRFVSSMVPRSLHPASNRVVTVRCPPKLEDDETAFAFQCPDNSLDPWIKAGSMLYATQASEPKVGDLILITDRNGLSRVRMLSDMDETGMILSRPSPFGADENVAYGDYESTAVVAVIDRV